MKKAQRKLVMARINSLTSEGFSRKEIADKLNADQVLTGNKKTWNEQAISNFKQNNSKLVRGKYGTRRVEVTTVTSSDLENKIKTILSLGLSPSTIASAIREIVG